jgi:hypothetical protein
MRSVNFFGINNLDKAEILLTGSNGTLPESVRDRLSIDEQEKLLEIIEGFEGTTDVREKEAKYSELMKLFYKGIGLDPNEPDTGKIPEEKQNWRAAFELSALINDAILPDQQNIGNIGNKYNDKQLKDGLGLQNRLRKDLEKTDFRRLLELGGGPYSTLAEGRKEYQTEKITSYLAENKDDFAKIFQKLSNGSKVTDLTRTQQDQLSNLQRLAGENGKTVLNTIFRTFRDFKDYSFTNTKLTTMGNKSETFAKQATGKSAYGNWVTVKGSRGSGDSDDDEGSSSSSRRGSLGDSETTNRILRRILARLEKLDPNNDGVNNSNGARGSRNNRSNNRCNCGNCANCNSCNNADNSSSNGNNGNNDIPSWARNIGLGLNLAGQFLNITGLGNNNQNGGCYSPPPCYGGGSPSPCPPMPYYVGGNTWPWGGANGINGQYGASNNAIPSSVSSNPYSTASAYNNTPVNVNVRVNPVFNNNPYMVSNSSALSSSNAYNLRRGFGIS